MSLFTKSAVLTVALLAGAAVAHAQSQGLASLPPGAAANAPAATAPVGPSTAYPGPNPGGAWYGSEHQTQAALQKSPNYVGPAPGGAWYGADQQTEAVVPSGRYPGPRPN